MKKLTVLLVTILTLGLYVPPIYIDADMDKGEVEPSEDQTKQLDDQVVEDTNEVVLEDSNQLYLQELDKQAEELVFEKLGKISTKIDTELNQVVLPNLKAVLHDIYEQIGEEESQYLMIKEEPSAGYGERIFNLYDAKQKQNVAKFHVNRVKRPSDGYYFQFHYHLFNDQFEEHIPLAEVYWGKNTPPQWMI
ncbi:YpjP family protein [Gracilibacillus caseinilyticus]|uniref:YpjP family protein n=1 Tax=Gracilibacillus caseinilyticus TaxID=2932256 RepID=A0ABY4EXT5_9BACI|nr:YpjP family protein [Gracilibacillus caseinilyticus]UOQ49225.1 YpjP family protein [Gracilibacillus caseinilyticus]